MADSDITNPFGSATVAPSPQPDQSGGGLSYITPPMPENNAFLRLLGKKTRPGPMMAVTNTPPDQSALAALGIAPPQPIGKDASGKPLFDYYDLQKRTQDLVQIQAAKARGNISHPPVSPELASAISTGDQDAVNSQWQKEFPGVALPPQFVSMTNAAKGTGFRERIATALEQNAKTRSDALRNMISQQNAKMGEDMAKSISDAKVSGTSSMGQQANKLDAAIHGRQIFHQAYNPQTQSYDLKPAQLAEIGMNVNRVITGAGATSDQARKDIESSTLQGDFSKLAQYVGLPSVPATYGELQNMYRDMLDRQGATSQDLFNAHAGRELAGFRGLQQRDPILHAYVMNNAFGTHDYRAFVQNGPDGAISNVPPPQNLGGAGVTPNSAGQGTNPLPNKTPKPQKAEGETKGLIHTYPSGKKVMYNPLTKQWVPYNG